MSTDRIYRLRKVGSETCGTQLTLGLLTVSIMLLLKLHYSTATAEHLRWILGPTAFLTSLFTAANPVWEGGIGYADFAHGIIVAPGCAGINFMIMAFGFAALCGLYHHKSPKSRIMWIVFALVASYGIALVVNTGRIALSMHLYGADIHYGWFTAQRVHRIAGVILYFSALWIFIIAARDAARFTAGRIKRRAADQGSGLVAWMILGWYLIGAIGVPLINGAWKDGPAAFLEHSLTVGSVALAILLGSIILGEMFRISFRWCKGRNS